MRKKIIYQNYRGQQIVIHKYISSNHILCVQDLEMEQSSIQPLSNKSRNVKKSFEDHKGKARVAPGFRFYCARPLSDC